MRKNKWNGKKKSITDVWTRSALVKAMVTKWI